MNANPEPSSEVTLYMFTVCKERICFLHHFIHSVTHGQMTRILPMDIGIYALDDYSVNMYINVDSIISRPSAV